MKNFFKDVRKHLLSGVSYMMPMVVAGGVILAISLLSAESTSKGMVPHGEIMQFLNTLGKAGLGMMIPVFAAYIAYSIAGRPGLAPGFLLGFVANNSVIISSREVKTGFLGALVLGLAVGYFVKWMKGIKVSTTIRSIMPILIIPIASVLVIGLAYYFLIGIPISYLMNGITTLMGNLQGGSKYLFAAVIGIFGELDFGGPVTKSVSMFTLALINEGNYFPNGLFRITVAVPPIGILISTIIAKNKYTQEERNDAKAAGILGFFGITEGAIPFAVKDWKTVMPSSIIGCIAGSIIGAIGNVTVPVPHGGLIVLPVVGNKLWFVVAIISGSMVTALMLKLLKKDVVQEELLVEDQKIN